MNSSVIATGSSRRTSSSPSRPSPPFHTFVQAFTRWEKLWRITLVWAGDRDAHNHVPRCGHKNTGGNRVSASRGGNTPSFIRNGTILVSLLKSDTALEWAVDGGYARVFEYLMALEVVEYNHGLRTTIGGTQAKSKQAAHAAPIGLLGGGSNNDDNHNDSNDEEGMTLLHWASQAGDRSLVEYLVDHCFTASHQEKELGRRLISKKHMDATDLQGRTALHWAIVSGKRNVVEYLITQCGASVDATDHSGQTPLHYACMRMHTTDVYFGLGSAGGKNKHDEKATSDDAHDDEDEPRLPSPCHRSTHANKTFATFQNRAKKDVLEYLVKQCGANVEARDRSGETPLHKASTDGYYHAVKFLAEQCQANVAAANNQGCTPLHNASSWGQSNVVKYLVKLGRVNVDARDHDGETALHKASVFGYRGVVDILVNHGNANVEATDLDGRTALHLVLEEGRTLTAAFLIKRCHANIEARDADGMTPLHIASRTGDINDVKLLVEHGRADVLAVDHEGMTPLHHAASRPYYAFDVVKFLVDRWPPGATLEKKDHQGRTPFHIADKQHDRRFAEFLASSSLGYSRKRKKAPAHPRSLKRINVL